MATDDALDIALEKIIQIADQRGVDVHGSFAAEIRNYSLHDIVKDLPSESLARALVGVGACAVEISKKAGAEDAAAGHVRESIMFLCPDLHGTCDRAATLILEIGDVGTSKDLYIKVQEIHADIGHSEG